MFKQPSYIFATLLLVLFQFLNFTNSVCDIPSLTTVSGTHAPLGKICPGDLIFEDNFDSLDLKIWQHELTLGGGGNSEFQWYDNNRFNSFVRNGTLFIKPTLLTDDYEEEFLSSGTLDINGGAAAEYCTNSRDNGCVRTGTPVFYLNPVKSARMRTMNSFAFKYGKVEVQAKLPSGDWLWPAIWLRPRYDQYSNWPRSGEIDLMESRGNIQLYNADGEHMGCQRVGSTIHWGLNSTLDKYKLTMYNLSNPEGFNSDFHKYIFEWTTEKFSFYVDDTEIGSISPPDGGFWELGEFNSTGGKNPWEGYTKMAPFDQEFYFVLNLAIGGTTFFSDSYTNLNGLKPWLNTSPMPITDFWNGRNQWLSTWHLDTDNAALQIDYVRVWAL